jgi:hypothetical protein
MGTGVSFSEDEADHLFPSSAKVRKVWSCTLSSSYVYKVWYFVKHMDTFILPLDVLSKIILLNILLIRVPRILKTYMNCC